MKLSKGLYKDTDPIDQLLGTYPNARNVLINKVQGAIVNELGFSRVKDLNRKIVGSIPIINDEIIIFSRDDDAVTQTSESKYRKFKLTIPYACSGVLSIVYQNADNETQTEEIDIEALKAGNIQSEYVIYLNGGEYIRETDSSTLSNNFTFTFSISSSTDSDNVVGSLTVTGIGDPIEIIEETYISEIGRLDKNGTYTTILRSKKLNLTSNAFLKGCYVLNYKKEVIIAWTDDTTPPKILNIDNLPFQVNVPATPADIDANSYLLLNEKDIVLAYLFPEYKRPRIVYNEILDSGGALKSGAYFFAFAYELEDGSQTNYTPLEGPFIVTDSTLELSGSYRQDMQSNFEIVAAYDGCEPDTTTSKSIKFTLTDVDNRYKYLLFSVYKKIGGQVTSEFIKRISIENSGSVDDQENVSTVDPNSYIVTQEQAEFTITYTGKETTRSLLLEDISVGNETYSTAKTITYFESKLYLGNVTTNVDFNYQPYAMQIGSEWVKDNVDINSVNGSYKNELTVYNKRGFRPDEVYAFYIAFLYKDGTWSGAFHIPGRKKEQITVALQNQDDTYLTPITINEDIKLSDIVLGNTSDGDTLVAADRTKYEEIFKHDIGIHDNTRYFQTRETARINGKMGYWQNSTEMYPNDESVYGTSAGNPVRHHKFPGYETMNGLNTSIVDPSSDGSQPHTGTGSLVVLAYMETCEIDLRDNLHENKIPKNGASEGYNNPPGGYDFAYTRERVWHHLYLYVEGGGTAAPGYYFLAKSRDPREFTTPGSPYYHYLTDSKIEISGNMRCGGVQHSTITPDQIVNPGTSGVTTENLYPNMLTAYNIDQMPDGLDLEYEGVTIGAAFYDNVPPQMPRRTGLTYKYLTDPWNLQHYEGKLIGHWWHDHQNNGICIRWQPNTQVFSRTWGEKQWYFGRNKTCRCCGIYSGYDYTMKHDAIIYNEDDPADVFPIWWNDVSIEAAGAPSGNGIKTLKENIEFSFTAGLGNYAQPSFISSQPYGAEGVATVKQDNARPAVATSALAEVNYEMFHTDNTATPVQTVAQAPLTNWTAFDTDTTGDVPNGYWTNDNYTYVATHAHTLYLTGKFGAEFKTKRLSGAPAGDQKIAHTVISGIRRLRKKVPSITSTWEYKDVFRNRESNSKILKATNDAITTSTLGGDFLSEDVENVFRPDFHAAITLQGGDILQFYHETVISGADATYTGSQYETRVSYEYDFQVLTYKYTMPEPTYSPYSMYASVLGIRFTNIEIPQQLKDNVQGYQFFYAERNSANMQTFDQSIAFHGAPHAIYPSQEGTYAGHLIPLGGLNLRDAGGTNTNTNIFGDTGVGYTGSAWTQNDDTEGGLSLDVHGLAKQHKIIPTSLRFHGFDILNSKPTIQSAYVKQVAKLGAIEYTDVLSIKATLDVDDVAGGADTTNFIADPAGDRLGVYTKTPGTQNSIYTAVQASYNHIWNRFGTSTTAARNPSFKLITNHYNQLRQLRRPSYVPADTVVNKKSITVNNTWGEECLHATIVHYDNDDLWSELNHHTGFKSAAVSSGVTTYTDPYGWGQIRSNYIKSDGSVVTSSSNLSKLGPSYNLVDLKSYKNTIYDSYFDQKLASSTSYQKLSSSDLLELRYKNSIIKESGAIYGGDTYVGMYGIRITAPIFYTEGKKDIAGGDVEYYESTNKFEAVKNIFYFPVYTSSNVSLRHAKETIIDSYYPKAGIGGLSNVGETQTVGSLMERKKFSMHEFRAREVNTVNSNILNYNEDYTSINVYNTLTIFDHRDVFLDKFPFRVVRSMAYGVENKTMALKQFKTNDYYEMPKNRGHLTNLEGLGKELFIHHEHSLFKTTTKDVIATDSATATLGTGDIFSFEPTELITSENGYAGCQHLSSVLISKAGYSFVDAEQGKIFLVTDTLQEVSAMGMKKWFKDNLPFSTTVSNTDIPFNLGGAGFTTAFDEENNRIILSKKDVSINVSVVTDVQIPSSALPINPYCQIGDDGYPTGYIIYQNLQILDQYGNEMLVVVNQNSGDYASFYVAPYLDIKTCRLKPNVSIQWNANFWEGNGKLKLTATLDEAQAHQVTVNVQYSGVFDETTHYPATSIVIPAGSTSAYVEGTTVSNDTVQESSPEETLTATIVSVTGLLTNDDGDLEETDGAAEDISGPQTIVVYDCPILANDSKSGITNGGTVSITPLVNDYLGSNVAGFNGILKIVSLPVDGSGNSIGTLKDPGNSNATLAVGDTVQGTTISFTHVGGNAALSGSFQYSYTKGPCTSTATVTLTAIAVSNNTYIKIFCDASGSMNSSLDDLQTMVTTGYADSGGLRSLLQDFYATGQTMGQGNTDTATNGVDDYNSHVTVVTNWSTERTFDALNNAGASFGGFSNADNVVIFVFQDEANTGYHGSSFSASGSRTTQYDTDMAALRSSVASLNSSDTTFYRGGVFQIATTTSNEYAAFKSFLQAVQNGTGSYSSTNGLSTSPLSNYFSYTYDVVKDNGYAYYKGLVQTALQNLGYNV